MYMTLETVALLPLSCMHLGIRTDGPKLLYTSISDNYKLSCTVLCSGILQADCNNRLQLLINNAQLFNNFQSYSVKLFSISIANSVGLGM